jgi:hypothetical protein
MGSTERSAIILRVLEADSCRTSKARGMQEAASYMYAWGESRMPRTGERQIASGKVSLETE